MLGGTRPATQSSNELCGQKKIARGPSSPHSTLQSFANIQLTNLLKSHLSNGSRLRRKWIAIRTEGQRVGVGWWVAGAISSRRPVSAPVCTAVTQPLARLHSKRWTTCSPPFSCY